MSYIMDTCGASVLVGDGTITTGNQIDFSAWCYRQQISITAKPKNGKRELYAGITINGDCLIRESIDFALSAINYYRDYNSFSIRWISVPLGDRISASGDGRILFGQGKAKGSVFPIPCYWTISGSRYLCPGLFGKGKSRAFSSSKNGQIIAGTTDVGPPIGNSLSPTTKAFRWDTATNDLTFFLPDGFVTAAPTFVSPDGKLFQFVAATASNTGRSLVVDFSNPTERAKGPQELKSWLISHFYVSATETQGQSAFQLFGMSDNGITIVGTYVDSQHAGHAFIAHKL